MRGGWLGSIFGFTNHDVVGVRNNFYKAFLPAEAPNLQARSPQATHGHLYPKDRAGLLQPLLCKG